MVAMRLLIFLEIATVLGSLACHAAGLTQRETAIVRAVDRDAPGSIRLLETLVNINSGTFNRDGVRAVAHVLEVEFRNLGFNTRFVLLDAVKRAPALVAEHAGSRGQRVMLIGHMDTVFEPSNPFQKFVRNGDMATGPGTADMKGGIVVMLFALKALRAAHVLDDANISVFLTSDGESVGNPVRAARNEFIEMGKHRDVILSFEPAISDQGRDYITTARRGETWWELRVQAHGGSSSRAIFELARVLNQFHDGLKEQNMTYSAGLARGGSAIQETPNGEPAVSASQDVVPDEAMARGDLRVLGIEQLLRVEEEMQAIVAQHQPGATSEIRFSDRYPPMGPAPGNVMLMNQLNAAGRRLGARDVRAQSPMEVGVADVSFVAPYASALDSLGAFGIGMHSPGESVDIARMPQQIKRVALLMNTLTHQGRTVIVH